MPRRIPDFAASRKWHPKSPTTGHRKPRPLRATEYHVDNLEEFDYESDTPFPGWEEEESEVHQWRGVSPARTLRTPCPFPDLLTSEGRVINTNCLDEAQEQQSEAAHRTALMHSHPRLVVWNTLRFPLLKRKTRSLNC
ncbi:hypothetical protein Plhal304r1_c081g0166651 [Plasmopara halstedii]